MSQAYFGNFDMNRFDFLGFHESRKEDISRLARELNLPFNAKVMENISPCSEERRRIEENASILGTMTDLLAADVRFYDTLRARH